VAAPGTNIYGPIPNRELIWNEIFNSETVWDLTGTWGLTAISQDSSPYSLSTSPSGDYDPNLDITARSPAIDMAGKRMALMTFFLRGSSEKNYDKLYLETSASKNGPWMNQTVEILSSTEQKTHFADGISGDAYTAWAKAGVLLTTLDDYSQAYIRFRFVTDSNNIENETYTGWSIDDINIKALDDRYPPPEENHYKFQNGTSFATPFVSGVAGLIWSKTPGLSFAQVKDSIINGVESLPEFEEKLLSGGRINANNSLNISLSLEPASTSESSSNENNNSGESSCFIRTAMPR
jgi:subtilisin family serine protease